MVRWAFGRDVAYTDAEGKLIFLFVYEKAGNTYDCVAVLDDTGG